MAEPVMPTLEEMVEAGFAASTYGPVSNVRAILAAVLPMVLGPAKEALSGVADAKALSGVRDQVAGWNGENQPKPYTERHPRKLGATLPKTNCGAVYDLDEALIRARTVSDQIAKIMEAGDG